MPSITPGYLYTFAALIAVSSLLIFSFMAYANTLRTVSEANKLKDLMDYVAAEGTELLTLTLKTNATSEDYLQMPATIGDKQYWIRFRNDSSRAWLEGGLGNTPVEESELRVYLPSEVSATGYYIGGYGAAHLECSLNGSVPQITISSGSD